LYAPEIELYRFLKAYILSLLNRIEEGFPSSKQRQEFPLYFLQTLHTLPQPVSDGILETKLK